jgi:Protein of unknown function (DUF3501)
MLPLTVEDLLPLEEYASRRREFFESHRRYVDRYRRARIGPNATLVFENRQTLWFRVQEILRVARLADPVRLQEELDLYNRLLPRRDRLQAVLLIEVPDETRLHQELAPWQRLTDNDLSLCIGKERYPARLITCRPEDRCLGAAHWVEFALAAGGRQALADVKKPAFFELTLASDHHKSPPLGEDVRQSLLEDLRLSDRDGEMQLE